MKLINFKSFISITIESRQTEHFSSIVNEPRILACTGKRGWREEYKFNNFESILQSKVVVPKDLKILWAVEISSYQNGLVNIYENYDDKCVTYSMGTSTSLDVFQSMPPVNPIGISIEKVTDLKKFNGLST